MESKAAVESRMKKEKQEIKQEKPPGWDHEDDYLEKVHKIKEKTIVEVKQIDNERVRYKCPSCNYSFVFNIFSKKPSLCPYCNHKVRSMKIVK